MATQTEVNTGRRLAQERLRSLDDLRKQYREACDEVKEAERLVHLGEKHSNYTERRQEVANDLARQIDTIANTTPQQLRNTCKDEALLTQKVLVQRRRNCAQNEAHTCEKNHDDAMYHWRRCLANFEGQFGLAGDVWQKADECPDGTFTVEWLGDYDTRVARETLPNLVEARRNVKTSRLVLDAAKADWEDAKQAFEENREAMTWSPV